MKTEVRNLLINSTILIYLNKFFSQEPKIINTVKAVTSADVFSGVVHAINNVMTDVPITAIMFGTTHFINALIQRKDLARICTIRLCGSASHAIPPMSN